MFTVTVCSIEFIWYAIYPLSEKRQKYFICLMGAFGALSICLCLYESIAQGIPFVAGGKLSENALGVLHGAMFLSVFAAYLGKKIYDHKTERED